MRVSRQFLNLDGSPLDIAVTLARGGRSGLHAKIDRGAWKSAKLQGEWAMESSFADSRGELHVQVGELGDLDHRLGRCSGQQRRVGVVGDDL